MGIALRADAKNVFFDRFYVKGQIDETTRRGFLKIGALVRRVMKNSIRYSSKASVPGSPPRAHGSFSLLRELIYFAYSPESRSVVIGPAQANGRTEQPPGATVPEVLELGGTIIFARRQYLSQTERARGRVKWRVREEARRHLQPRPFAGPALDKTRQRYARLWADSWRGGGAARGK